ncbi:MAG: menaquinone biosynthesis protein [Armatimonadota bacterium]|nr:menaquinone biosynthesis protein [Armatimonadota bacterium]
MFTLGVVPYLNALPLYRTLETSGAARLIRAVPSRLAPYLASGGCDVALIPIVDHFRGAGAAVISNACIGSNGPVRSVLLFSRVPVTEIKSVAIDTSSHTSVALLRVILGDGYHVQPAFVDHAPDLHAMLEQHDAALLIGDKALEATEEATRVGTAIIDLGAAWTFKLTKKPFVYAAWVTRPGLSAEASEELAALLSWARDKGVAHLSELVKNSPVQTRLTPEQVEDYLSHAVDYYLTPAHRAGMEIFRLRCVKYGLVGPRS